MSAVLIVEDETGLRQGLVAAVERLGFTAHPAASLAEARALLKRTSLDCVLLDIRLKDGDGTLLATSGKGYKTKADCQKVIDTIKRDAGKAKVEDMAK